MVDTHKHLLGSLLIEGHPTGVGPRGAYESRGLLKDEV
jgi:hypothetical protein